MKGLIFMFRLLVFLSIVGAIVLLASMDSLDPLGLWSSYYIAGIIGSCVVSVCIFLGFAVVLERLDYLTARPNGYSTRPPIPASAWDKVSAAQEEKEIPPDCWECRCGKINYNTMRNVPSAAGSLTP